MRKLQHKLSIRNKLMRVIMLVSGIVVLLTCGAFFLYEYYSFRQSTVQKLETYGEIISYNSTAALAFESEAEAAEILAALEVEPSIIAAAIYDSDGRLFCSYPANISKAILPETPGKNGYMYSEAALEGFQPIVQGSKRLGTLYLKSDLQAMYDRFWLYAFIVLIILIFSFFTAFLLSRFLQKGISRPILALAETAKAVSDRNDYSVRAAKLGDDEVGSLTDAFNHMLTQIEGQTATLNEFNQNLERRVKDRTAELEAANNELESFSYSVSHDLRSPVNSMHRYAHLFKDRYSEQVDDEGKRLINVVIKNAKKMGKLIDDLLAFSQLGRLELIKSNLNMKDLVLQVWNDQSKSDDSRKIEFIIDGLPDAYAEQTTMEQVWTNLISNALKYTRNTPETIIKISAAENENETIYSISDNGSGFDMKYYAKMFGVFQRLHSQEEFEGTGVGLAIVERIVKKHGGRLWAEGVVNEGATFFFSLPNQESKTASATVNASDRETSTM